MDTSGFNSIEDLLADPGFPQYCMGTDPAAVAHWEQWIKDHPEQKAMVEKARELYLFLNGGHTRARYEQDRDHFLRRFKQHAGERHLFTIPEKPVPPRRKALRRSLIAFTVVITAVVLIWNYRSTQSPAREMVLRTKAGQQKKYNLPDGSSILLNSSSTVTIAAGFNERHRDIYLSGEAYFEVAPNAQQPFMVHTHTIFIRVLGTVFNVKAYPDDTVTATSLLQGAIKVFANRDVAGVWLPKEGLLLSANQKLHVVKSSTGNANTPLGNTAPASYQLGPLATDAALNTVVETDWTRGRLSFNDMPFDRIALELERWYGVKIRFENEQLKQSRFVATFDKENIDQVLRALQATTSFSYRKTDMDSTIILY
jgi:ferric-dicitrate binding protein FerR (iron transport regulator)